MKTEQLIHPAGYSARRRRVGGVLLVLLSVVACLPKLEAQNTDVTISNQSVFISGGTPVSVQGGLTNTNSASLTNNGDLRLTGHLTNNATVNPGTGALHLAGVSPQVVSSTGMVVDFGPQGSLYLDNPAGARLQSVELRLADSLVLLQGVLQTDTAGIAALQAKADVRAPLPPNNSSYVEGPLIITLDTSARDSLYLPLGLNGVFTPVWLRNYQPTTIPASLFFHTYRVGLAAGPTGGAAQRPLDRLHARRYLYMDLVGYSPNFNPTFELEYTWTAADSLANFAQQINHLRLARSLVPAGTGPTGNYTQGGGLGASSGNLGLGSITSQRDTLNPPTESEAYWTLGVAKAYFDSLEAQNGQLRDTLCEGDTNLLRLLGASTPTLSWQQSTDSLSWTNTGAANVDSQPTGVLRSSQYYRAILTQTDQESDTTPGAYLQVNPSIKYAFRAFLQGAYDPALDQMQTQAAMTGTVLPTRFQAPGAPPRMWPGYSVPAQAVDVVKAELRPATDPTQIHVSQRAWLLADGSIRDFETGAEAYLETCDLPNTDSTFLAVQHRNHLGLIGAQPQLWSTAVPPPLDLTDSTAVQHPGVQVLELVGPTTVVGLAAGNVEETAYAPQEINALDLYRAETLSPAANTYSPLDTNLDGQVDASDASLVGPQNDRLLRSAVPR